MSEQIYDDELFSIHGGVGNNKDLKPKYALHTKIHDIEKDVYFEIVEIKENHELIYILKGEYEGKEVGDELTAKDIDYLLGKGYIDIAGE